MCDPVGVRDIAERLGMAQQTVAMWKWRGLMPDPDWHVSGFPAWDWSTISSWAQATGRLTA